MDRASVICKLAMKWYLMRMCPGDCVPLTGGRWTDIQLCMKFNELRNELSFLNFFL